MMKLNIPLNWDKALIDHLPEATIHMAYGKLQRDVVGGGRAPYMLRPITKRQIQDQVDLLHSKGIKFNYLLNAPCLGNMEHNREQCRKVFQLLDWLRKIGADYVTVATPYLLQIVKSQYPEIKVAVSKFARIETARKAQYYDQLGADIITLDNNVIRNFNLLAQIRESVGCNIQILVNNMCLYQCPFALYHANGVGHASQSEFSNNEPYVSLARYSCRRIMFSDLSEVIRSRWVRPEDLVHYEEVGIDNFKLVDRNKPTAWLLRAVGAYLNRSYDGNLLDLMGSFKSPSISADYSPDAPEADSNTNQADRDWLELNVFIDNKQLDGVLAFFKKMNCEMGSCKSCDFCDRTAKRVIEFDKRELERSVDNLNRIVTGLLYREQKP